MPPRIPPLRHPPIGFAHRGARAQEPDNTLAGFALALRLGATGLETDAWITADGEAVLDHDGTLRRGLRKRPIGAFTRADLPTHIPTLSELYRSCGTDYELSVDVKDPDAIVPVMATAERTEQERQEPVVSRLWLCTPDLDDLRAWRARWPEVRLVHSVRLARMSTGPERHAATLAEMGIDAINMHYTDWNGGLTSLMHRFELLAFGWDAQHERVLHETLDAGLDGIYSDHVDRMVEAITRLYGRT